jgi:hypothetical protein
MTVDVAAGDWGCSTDVCAGLGATEAKAVPGREERREDDRDLELTRGEAVTHNERPKKEPLTFTFCPTIDSVKDDLSANVGPTAEVAETLLERVVILKPLPLTKAEPFHGVFVTDLEILDTAALRLLLQPREALLVLMALSLRQQAVFRERREEEIEGEVYEEKLQDELCDLQTERSLDEPLVVGKAE